MLNGFKMVNDRLTIVCVKLVIFAFGITYFYLSFCFIKTSVFFFMLVFVKTVSYHIGFSVAFGTEAARWNIKEFLNLWYIVPDGKTFTLTKQKHSQQHILQNSSFDLCDWYCWKISLREFIRKKLFLRPT